jgi:hypothetical protein
MAGAWRQLEPQDRVVLLLATVLAVFLLASLFAIAVLSYRSQSLRQPDENLFTVWRQVFDLVQVMAGGIVGYATGGVVARSRHRDAERKDP